MGGRTTKQEHRRGTRQRANWLLRSFVALLLVALLAGAAMLLQSSQQTAKQHVADRFTARSVLAGNFVSTYANQLIAREETVAKATLSGPTTSAAFDSDVRAFGFTAAVLLNSDGRALAIAPHAPALIGQPLGAEYAHLISALHGKATVSNVVTSAVRAVPVVAFAVPFQTSQGRRVFSGAYPASDTPIAAFLNDTTTLRGAHLFLVDAKGTVIATNGSAVADVRTLTERDPELAREAASHSNGTYHDGQAAYFFARTRVPGTPWTLLIAAPSKGVFVSVSGSSQWGPWLILACLAAIAGLACWLGIRFYEERRRLRAANLRLLELATTDTLTSLSNRRHVSHQLETMLANVRRGNLALSVLLIDIDNFKRLDDSLGHQAGDKALRHIARTLTGSLREGDLLARWGGEEFLAVLPATDLAGAITVAERLRDAVASEPVTVGEFELIAMRVSVGVAEAGHESLEELVNRSDLGLYEAKASGRNAVRVG